MRGTVPHFSHGATAAILPGPPYFRLHSDTLQSVGLRWKSDKPEADLKHTTLTTDRQPCPQPEFKRAIVARERPQTHAIDLMCRIYLAIIKVFSNTGTDPKPHPQAKGKELR